MKKSRIIKLFSVALFAFGALLLSSCNGECAHNGLTKVVAEPTHQLQGFTTYTCTDCSYSYNAEYTAPVGHTLKQEIHAPTCTEEGYTRNVCDCGYEFNSDVLPPTAHILTSVLFSPTCTQEGYTLKICDCGYQYKTDVVTPTGHVLTVLQTIPPTCADEGVTLKVCTACNKRYEYPIAPLGHDIEGEKSYVSVNSQAAGTRYTCTRCDLDYVGDYVFYHNIYKGAYVDNTSVLAKGLDVSYHQHDRNAAGEYLPLDWVTIKATGYDFAILRAGYMRSGQQGVVDAVYEMNYRDARAAGLDLGVYFFSYAYTVEDAIAEAEFLLTLLDGKTFEYPIFFDIEHSDAKLAELGLTVSELTDICSAFIDVLQKNGYYAALYTNNKWLTTYLDTARVTTMFDIWYARYPSIGGTVTEGTWNTEKYGKQMAMWQFSKTGIIDGIIRKDGSGENVVFDMNYAYKDYPTIIKELGYNGFNK